MRQVKGDQIGSDWKDKFDKDVGETPSLFTT